MTVNKIFDEMGADISIPIVSIHSIYSLARESKSTWNGTVFSIFHGIVNVRGGVISDRIYCSNGLGRFNGKEVCFKLNQQHRPSVCGTHTEISVYSSATYYTGGKGL